MVLHFTDEETEVVPRATGGLVSQGWNLGLSGCIAQPPEDEGRPCQPLKAPQGAHPNRSVRGGADEKESEEGCFRAAFPNHGPAVIVLGLSCGLQPRKQHPGLYPQMPAAPPRREHPRCLETLPSVPWGTGRFG